MFTYKFKQKPLLKFPKENQKFIIYKHTNKINGKCYIGQTSGTMETRWEDHIKNSQKENPKYYFHIAIKKYGEDVWEHEILEEFNTQLFCNAAEIYLIDFYQSINKVFGYNMTKGGTGGAIKKGKKYKPLTQEHKNKLSEIKKGKKCKPFSKEHKEKISKANKGKKLSFETKTKISQALINKQHTNVAKQNMKIAQNRPEVIQRNSESHKGKKLSIEHKQKFTRKGKNNSIEHRQKISESKKGEKNPMFGKPHSQDTKQKRNESNKIAQNRPETKLKKSESMKGKNKGKKMSDEQKQKLSKINLIKNLGKILMSFYHPGTLWNN